MTRILANLEPVAEGIGWVVLVCFAVLALAFVVSEGAIKFAAWRQRRRPVELERRLGLVVCDCGQADCPSLAGRWTA